MVAKTTYRQEYCQQLIDHMDEGLSFYSFAGRLKIATSTLEKWAKDFPDFAEAKEIGQAACLFHWEKLASQVRDKDINTGLVVLNMHNRFRRPELGGWRKGDVIGTHSELLDSDGKSLGFVPVEGYKGSDKI